MDYLNKFSDWYASAKKGDAYTYYYGFLCNARDPIKGNDELHMLADKLWKMAEQGHVSLVQRRGEFMRFAYIAQKVR